MPNADPIKPILIVGGKEIILSTSPEKLDPARPELVAVIETKAATVEILRHAALAGMEVVELEAIRTDALAAYREKQVEKAPNRIARAYQYLDVLRLTGQIYTINAILSGKAPDIDPVPAVIVIPV